MNDQEKRSLAGDILRGLNPESPSPENAPPPPGPPPNLYGLTESARAAAIKKHSDACEARREYLMSIRSSLWTKEDMLLISSGIGQALRADGWRG